MGNSETETEKQRMAVCGLSLHLGGSESPYDINERFSFTFDSVNLVPASARGREDMKHAKGLGNIKDV